MGGVGGIIERDGEIGAACWLWKNATALQPKSRPAIFSVVHFPDIDAKVLISASGGLVSFAARMTGREGVRELSGILIRPSSDGAATDEVAREITATAKICQQRRIVMLGHNGIE